MCVHVCTCVYRFNQGQVCSAGSRLLIQENVYDKVIRKIKERMKHLRVGSSLDKCMDIGALVDTSQLKTIEKFVQIARDEGGDVYQACACMPASGLYYPPTLVTNVQTTSTIVQEEIFGMLQLTRAANCYGNIPFMETFERIRFLPIWHICCIVHM